MKVGGEVALGGQGVVGTQHPALDRLAQSALKLQIKRQGAGFIQSAQGLRQRQRLSPHAESVDLRYYQYKTSLYPSVKSVNGNSM